MAIVALHPSFQEIIDPEAAVEKIAGGFVFTEGPVWHSGERSLVFSDIQGDRLSKWTQAAGAVSYRQPSGQANGNSYDRQGRLLTCEHANRRVSRTLADGTVETLAGSFEGKRLSSPNDVLCAPNGDLYFTDPPYGLRRQDGSIAGQEMPCNGVFRWSAATGALTLLADDFARPNGLVLTDDARRMYIADTQHAHVRLFDVTAEGLLANGRLFVETTIEGVTARPDGMKLDSLGNLYVTTNTPTGVWVYNPEGRLIGRIEVGEGPANCAFGGDDWRTLFVTAQSSVYRVRLKVPGQAVIIGS